MKWCIITTEMNETRVNLKHLLKDLRDSYPIPYEEVIVTELIANALDSGASEIRFLIDLKHQTLTIADNGKGMTAPNLKEYHDIAATTKVRGKGIGFAGVGVKLALLEAGEIITETKTETKSGAFCGATKWRLEGAMKAPWNYIKPQGLIHSPTGTAVSIVFPNDSTKLLKAEFVKDVIQTHFHPIVNQNFMNEILRDIYKRGITFFVNGRKVDMSEAEKPEEERFFFVNLGKRGKQLGYGFLGKNKEELPEEKRGIAISTYGKVIKRGWDWIGISPRNPMRLTGIVEIPELCGILTTNKADFLKDAASNNKFYKYRKAIKEAIEPILRDFGEISETRKKPQGDYRHIEKEVERIMGNMLNDFPELSPLMGRRGGGEKIVGVISDPESPLVGTITDGVDMVTGTKGGSGKGAGVAAISGDIPEERIEINSPPTEAGRKHEGRRRRPGLRIAFAENPDSEGLGWIDDDTIFVNMSHPAYKRAIEDKVEIYHNMLSFAWVLSCYVESGKGQTFINRFLLNWGSGL